jgi:hypothetical protein
MRILLLALYLLPRAEAAAPLHLKWAELAPAVAGRQVSIATAGGVVRGKAVAVESDALVVQAKGRPVRVPRASLRRFEVQMKGVKFRVIGTALGVIAGAAAGAGSYFAIQGGIFSDNNTGGAAVAFFAATAVGATGGYLIGNSGDKHWTPVVVLD